MVAQPSALLCGGAIGAIKLLAAGCTCDNVVNMCVVVQLETPWLVQSSFIWAGGRAPLYGMDARSLRLATCQHRHSDVICHMGPM